MIRAVLWEVHAVATGAVISTKLDLDAINARFADADPTDVVKWAVEAFGEGLVLTSSFGAESALMLHMVTRIAPGIPVVTIDTGYFFPETYLFIEEMTKRFNLNLKMYQSPISPARMEAIQGRLWEQGKEALVRYNQLRKVEPMDRAIRELLVRGWVSGLRADQTNHRATLRVVEVRHDGVYKVHPILKWTQREIAAYFTIHDLPYHPLVEKGYASIGDHHSTTPAAGREGRFLGLKQECGLHLPASKGEDDSRGASDL